MIDKGFTEREYDEEFTLGTLGKMAMYYEERDKAVESLQRRERNRQSAR